MQTKLLLPIPTILLLAGCAASVGNLPALTAENEESLRMWKNSTPASSRRCRKACPTANTAGHPGETGRRNGTVTRLQTYNRAGRLEKDEIIDCAARTRMPVAVRPDGAKP